MASLLIVDPRERTRLALRGVLERVGHSVEDVASVAEARDRLGAGTVELVVCDIHLAGEPDLAVICQMGGGLPDADLIIVGAEDAAETDNAMAVGGYGQLGKPFRPNEVVLQVNSALRRRDLNLARRGRTEGLGPHPNEPEVDVLTRTTAAREALEQSQQAEARSPLSEFATVQRLVAALTMRTGETRGHLERTSRGTAALAAAAGLRDWTYDEVRAAAMLHDVGKIGIPESTLLKPGPLDDEERSVVRLHCELGARIIGESGSGVMALAATVALSHHERWDGKGYPRGLAGDSIPFEGRILHVVDAFDAMTSPSVYHAAVSPDQAMRVIHAERARKFDPELVDLFAAEIDGMLAIRDRYTEPDPGRGVRVILVSDRRLFADALSRALMAAPGIVVVGTPASLGDVDVLLAARDADVVIIDADLTDIRTSPHICRQVLTSHPRTAVLLLAARDDDGILRAAFDAGCAGVVLRDRAFDDLPAAVLAAHRGEPVVSRSRFQALLNRGSSEAHGGLTLRETTVLGLMAEGLSNDVIAARLFVSLNTARNHVQRILTKLSAHSKLEAVVEATRRGLLPKD